MEQVIEQSPAVQQSAQEGTNLNEVRNKLALANAQPVASYRAGFGDSQGWELLQRQAKALAASALVPEQYINNVPNCIIALELAARIGASPLMVMQNLTIVHGRPSWSAQFLVATVNASGRFSALRYEFFGTTGKDDWGCRAWAVEKATGEKLVGTDVTIAMARGEGWYDRKGSKWKTMPQQMLMYRAAGWWTRVYAPELSMGLRTEEEEHEVYDARRSPNGDYEVPKPAEKVVEAAVVEDGGEAKAPPKRARREAQDAPGKVTEAVASQFSLGDAHAAVERGEYTTARQIATMPGMPETMIEEVESLIAARQRRLMEETAGEER